MTDFAGQWVGTVKDKIVSKHNTTEDSKKIESKFQILDAFSQLPYYRYLNGFFVSHIF